MESLTLTDRFGKSRGLSCTLFSKSWALKASYKEQIALNKIFCPKFKVSSLISSVVNLVRCESRPMIACAVSNVIGSLLMSMTFKSSEDKTFLRLLNLMEEGFKLFTLAAPVNFFPFLRFVPGVNYAYKKIIQNRTETSSYFKKIVDEHRNTLDGTQVRDFVNAYLVQEQKIKASNQRSYFSEEQLIQVLNDIFSAGLENVTSTIEWSVLFLMINPLVQKRIQSEIDRVVGRERMPKLDDLSSMPYTEATFWEVLRRSNVVAFGIPHSTLE